MFCTGRTVPSEIREQQFNQSEYRSQERRSLPVFLQIIGSINEKRLRQAGNLRTRFIFKIKPRYHRVKFFREGTRLFETIANSKSVYAVMKYFKSLLIVHGVHAPISNVTNLLCCVKGLLVILTFTEQEEEEEASLHRTHQFNIYIVSYKNPR